MTKFFTFALAMFLATSAVAHSPLRSTTPENAAVLTEVPAEISMEFTNDIRLARVDMTHDDHPTVTLELGGQTSFATGFVLPMDDMGDGTYLIEWRGLGADGHVMQGQFSFSVE